MRATKGYVAGVGTTSALMGAIGCAFAVLSTVVAVHGWPLSPGASGVATLDGRSAADGAFPAAFDAFPGTAARRARGRASSPRRGSRSGAETTSHGAGPLASAFGPASRRRAPATDGAPSRVPVAATGARAATPAPRGGAAAPPATGDPADAPTGAPGAGPKINLKNTITNTTHNTNTTITQTNQQLSGTVQTTTGQLGATIGQVNPVAGQTVTQTGQTAAGVVSGAAGTAGQIVSGAGATVGGLLGSSR